MKKAFVVLLLISFSILSFSQIEPLSPWNRDLNAALISWSARNFIELSGGLSSGIIQESLDTIEEAVDLNLLGNEGYYYNLDDSNILSRNVNAGMYAKLKLGVFVLAPEISISNIDWHDYSTLDYRNALWVNGGLHIGLKGKDFSFGGTIRSSLPVFDVIRRNNGEDYTLVTAFPDEKYNLPYTYSLLYDGPGDLFDHMDTLMDKLMNNGIITLDVGFVAGKDYPAIGFGVKNIPIADGIGIYKYDAYAHVEYSKETLEFSSFDLVNASNERIWSKFKPWKMTFFITLPIILDFVPSIEYAPNTEDFTWGVAAGKRLFWEYYHFGRK
ncbi:hypothetical protein [Marinitoga lauensis]|uniref:hypothetical protein n=1 Tax=Marinitoga lauensis TaxID=2201189 RepID=UPI001011BDD4|nr:hypothetical protein [Marinitoga lauensis]